MDNAEVGSVPVEPVADQTENLADLVDVAAEPVDVSANDSVDTGQPTFKALDAQLDSIDELKHDGFYKDITEDHIKELPTVARRILHNFRIDKKLQEKNHASEISKISSKIEEREARLAKMEREFARRQAEFAAVAEDPKLKAILDQPSDKMPDIFTEEGINARIQRGIAEGVRNILKPMQESAQSKARETAYLDFLEKHPEMRNTEFKSEVARMVRTRRDTGDPIKTQDAYQLVKARRILAEKQAKASRETKARAQSARRIGSNTSRGRPGEEGIPKDVMKRGANAIANWLQSNPEAAKKISATFS
tara:strand:+ start:16291 stop:17211 length:921 start_codon:yes stop_codon:yes gene_type:complete